jgi:hypothetical protein
MAVRRRCRCLKILAVGLSLRPRLVGARVSFRLRPPSGQGRFLPRHPRLSPSGRRRLLERPMKRNDLGRALVGFDQATALVAVVEETAS